MILTLLCLKLNRKQQKEELRYVTDKRLLQSILLMKICSAVSEQWFTRKLKKKLWYVWMLCRNLKSLMRTSLIPLRMKCVIHVSAAVHTNRQCKGRFHAVSLMIPVLTLQAMFTGNSVTVSAEQRKIYAWMVSVRLNQRDCSILLKLVLQQVHSQQMQLLNCSSVWTSSIAEMLYGWWMTKLLWHFVCWKTVPEIFSGEARTIRFSAIPLSSATTSTTAQLSLETFLIIGSLSVNPLLYELYAQESCLGLAASERIDGKLVRSEAVKLFKLN